MRKSIWVVFAAFLIGLPLSGWAQKGESLADAARKIREQKKEAPKAVKVFTNDNIPTTPGGISVVGGAPPAPAEKAGGENAAPAEAAPPKEAAESKKKEEEKGESYWRKRFAEARNKLQQAEKELDILQRELNLMQMQYYSNPAQALQQQYSREDIVKQRQKIADKQAEVGQLKQALSDLEDELRQAGGDPGWARE